MGCPGEFPRRDAPEGGGDVPYMTLNITLREGPKVADALEEYAARHLEVPELYRLRFGQLAALLRDGTERGLLREAEVEAKRWGKR